MDKGLIIVIGMTISYLFSVGGMLFAWSFYRRNKKNASTQKPNRDQKDLSTS
ncbi:MAG: hypothetical protein ONB24_11695 [candidate division KSB1 bacterium]|nr:hypothetical protein [candidate division KSB1 bacterium]